MTQDTAHSLFETQVAERYRAQGYEVIVEPQEKDIPFDLGSYHPDLIARKQSGRNYIIEIRNSIKHTTIDRLSEIAEIVKQHTGWGFLLVTGDDVESAQMKDAVLLTKDQIIQRKEHAQELLSSGEYASSFLFLWGLLEATLRLQAQTASIPVQHLPAQSLIDHMYSQGEISFEHFDQIKNLQILRNSLMHGFQTPDLSEPTRELYSIVNELTDLFFNHPENS